MAGIADIRFLTRPIQGYDVGGLVQFIPPELRAHAGAITTGIKAVADSMRISNPKDITRFGKEIISAIRAGQLAPTVTAIGNFGTAIAGSTLDILPGGTQVKTVAKTSSKFIRKKAEDVEKILTNFVKEGSTIKARRRAFDALGVERIKERPRFDGDMLRTLYKIKFPGKTIPKKVKEIKKEISEWSGDKPVKEMSELKKKHHREGLYEEPSWIEKISKSMTRRKKYDADIIIKKMKNMSEAERTKEMLKITDQGVLHRVKSHFPTGAAKLEKWSTPEAKKIYEIVRKRLIKEKGLDPADIHQAHGLEEMWYDLFPKKLRKELPFYRVPTENRINQFHDQLNKALYRSIAKREDPRWLKKKIRQKKFDDVKTLDKGIESLKRMIKDLKLETPVLSKKTKSIDWISPYKQGTSLVHKNIQFKKDYDKLVQRLPIKQKGLKKISPVLERLRHGGIASISHLTRPI